MASVRRVLLELIKLWVAKILVRLVRWDTSKIQRDRPLASAATLELTRVRLEKRPVSIAQLGLTN